MLLVLRRLAHLPHRCFETAVGIGIDREVSALAGRDAPDIGFVDLRMDLHVLQAMGDHEGRAGFEADRECLAFIDEPADHDAVDRRADHGAVEIGLRRRKDGRLLRHCHPGLIQLGLDPADVGLRAIHRIGVEGHHDLGLALLGHACGELRLRIVDGGRCHDVLRLERQLALQGLLRRRLDGLGAVELGDEHFPAALGVLQIDPGAIELGPLDVDEGIRDRQRRLGLVDLGREAAGIDQRKRLVLADGVVEIDIDAGELPRQLRADLDRLDGLQGARDGDGLLDAAALDRGIAEHGGIRSEGRGFACRGHQQPLGRFHRRGQPCWRRAGGAGDGGRSRGVDRGEAACSSEQGNNWHKSHIKNPPS